MRGIVAATAAEFEPVQLTRFSARIVVTTTIAVAAVWVVLTTLNIGQLTDALKKISPEAQQKTRAKAQEFEAMFLNSMFSQMTTGVKGEGPFGDTTGNAAWH